MKYNFDERIERRGTHCVKWDESPATIPAASPAATFPLLLSGSHPPVGRRHGLRRGSGHSAGCPPACRAPRLRLHLGRGRLLRRRHRVVQASSPLGHLARTYLIYYWCRTGPVVCHQGDHHARREGAHAVARLQLLLLLHSQQRLRGPRECAAVQPQQCQ